MISLSHKCKKLNCTQCGKINKKTNFIKIIVVHPIKLIYKTTKVWGCSHLISNININITFHKVCGGVAT